MVAEQLGVGCRWFAVKVLTAKHLVVGCADGLHVAEKHSLAAYAGHWSTRKMRLQELNALGQVWVHWLAGASGCVHVAGTRVSWLTAALVEDAQVSPCRCMTFV
jgi:hypothetical protein